MDFPCKLKNVLVHRYAKRLSELRVRIVPQQKYGMKCEFSELLLFLQFYLSELAETYIMNNY